MSNERGVTTWDMISIQYRLFTYYYRYWLVLVVYSLIYSNLKLEIEVIIDGLYQKIFKLEILIISVHIAPNGFKWISIFEKSIASKGDTPPPPPLGLPRGAEAPRWLSECHFAGFFIWFGTSTKLIEDACSRSIQKKIYQWRFKQYFKLLQAAWHTKYDVHVASCLWFINIWIENVLVLVLSHIIATNSAIYGVHTPQIHFYNTGRNPLDNNWAGFGNWHLILILQLYPLYGRPLYSLAISGQWRTTRAPVRTHTKQRVCARAYKLQLRAYVTTRRWRDGV